MAHINSNLLEINVDKLFEEHSIDEIIEVDKLLNAEIERKRCELRSTVGDRYKDVLTASDAIRSMKFISEDIVSNVGRITNTCEELFNESTSRVQNKVTKAVNRKKIEERILAVQIRLAIFMNEQIWLTMDKNNNLEAAQFYLLAQHIHTGLCLSKKEYLVRIPLLQQIKNNLLILKTKIFERISSKLESVEITAEETSSNLNALILLQNQSRNELLNIFIEHRKTALNTVIKIPHSNVRLQISAMVRCLITTIHILHDCFLRSSSGEGLIWQQLDEIVGDSSPTTFSKLNLPVTPLISYIPDIVRQFRPKCKPAHEEATKNTKHVLEMWLNLTRETIKNGLSKSLEVVVTVKGLHLIREEALKLELPYDWDQICQDTYLPENFNVWYHFFQNLISKRAEVLITQTIINGIKDIENDITSTLEEAVKSPMWQSELDLRWYVWNEEINDISKTANKNIGLSMKSKGYTTNVVNLCSKLDKKYMELLEDVSQYLYRKEFNSDEKVLTNVKDFKFKKKFIDKEELENHLRSECTKECTKITSFILDLIQKEEDELVITKSVMSARILQATLQLCPNFNKCCTINNNSEDWLKICDNFNSTSHILFQNWIIKCIKSTEEEILSLNSTNPTYNMMKVLAKWDTIEIQEQIDEKVFKSNIKVPLKPSLLLNSILIKLNNDLSSILPHTISKTIHVQFIENNVHIILKQYQQLIKHDLNQIQALQFLFDIKFLTTLCISRENAQLVNMSQDICDKLREKIDPFDLDVFYSYIQANVKRAVCQSQMILGCLLPSSGQLANLGISEQKKEQEKEPSVLALSISANTSWFPLLPITKPSQKIVSSIPKDTKSFNTKNTKVLPKKSQESSTAARSSAASLFGNLATDWFS